MTRSTAAILLARTGDASESEKLAADLAREFPSDTGLNSVWLPIARASNEVRRDNSAKAIALLEPARAYEHGTIRPRLLLDKLRAWRGIPKDARRG